MGRFTLVFDVKQRERHGNGMEHSESTGLEPVASAVTAYDSEFIL
jgi:hypothetical protein